MNKRIFLSALAAVLMLSGCGTDIEKIDVKRTTQTDSSSEELSDSSIAEEDVPEEPVVSYDEVTVTPEPTEFVKYTQTLQAEEGTLSGGATASSEREGFTGEGYVTELVKAEDWSVVFELPASQYYNVAITSASDVSCVNELMGNGAKLMEVSSSGSGGFETTIIKNVWLEKGQLKVNLNPVDGSLDIDRVTIAASSEISSFAPTVSETALSNASSGENTKALYSYLSSVYGKKIILGQYDTVGTTAETDMTFKLTGKYPAVRFGDLMNVTDADSSLTDKDIDLAIQWHNDGGIVGYMWHWKAPSEKSGFYAEDTDFNIIKAKTTEKTAEQPIESLEKMRDDGKIAAETVELIKDIDKAAAELKKLKDTGVPVLWRPLHEASNGLFWWGRDKDSYIWLWKVLYKRLNVYHGLDNLIWVWSAQNADWYVGDALCDITSADAYSDDKTESHADILLYLTNISPDKPVIMSECGSFPSIQSLADDNAFWGIIGHWGGSYMLTENGEFSDKYNTAEELIEMYNNSITVTRDKLAI